MYPQYPEDYQYQQQPDTPSKQKKILVLIGVGALALVIVISMIALLIPRSTDVQGPSTADSDSITDPGYKLTRTDFNAQRNFAVLQGDSINAYNGLAFFKQSIDGTKTVPLLAGMKLPHVSSLTWVGDKGALVSFDASYGGTQVYDILQKQGVSPSATATSQYVWYVDFASGSLRLFGKSALAVKQTAISSDGKGFYYAGPVTTDSTRLSKIPLGYYSFETNTAKNVVGDLKVSDVKSIATCKSGTAVCLNVTDAQVATQKVISVDPSGARKELTSVKGRLISTSDPDKYIVIQDEKGEQTQAFSEQNQTGEHQDDTDTDSPEIPARLYDAKNGQTTDLGFNSTINNLYMLSKQDGSFIVLDNSYNANQPRTISVKDFDAAYRAGTVSQGETGLSKLFALRYAGNDKDKFTDTTIQATYGNDAILMTGTSQMQNLLSKTSSGSLTAVSANTFAATSDACLSSAGAGAGKMYDATQKTMDIQIRYDANFYRHIQAFSACIAGKGKDALIGYSYTFSGVDPVNSRLVTD